MVYSSDLNGSFELYIKQLTPGGGELQLTNDGQQNFGTRVVPGRPTHRLLFKESWRHLGWYLR